MGVERVQGVPRRKQQAEPRNEGEPPPAGTHLWCGRMHGTDSASPSRASPLLVPARASK